MPTLKPITPKELRFCQEYVVDYSPVNAMKRAGYAVGTATHNSGEMMRRPQVQAKLKELSTNLSVKTGVTAERVVMELGHIATANLADFYKYSEKKKKWVLKSLDELTPAQQGCIAKYKPGEYLELHSKEGSLDKLAKYFKLYSEIDSHVTNFVVMPTLKLSGKEIIFEVGKPAPKAAGMLKEKN